MPTRAARRKLRSPAIEQRLNRHARIGQKARKSHNPTASATRQAPQADARARHHSREQQTPLFARRSSPKSPSPQFSEVITSRPPFKVGQSNHAPQNPSSAPRKPNLKMCASPRYVLGGHLSSTMRIAVSTGRCNTGFKFLCGGLVLQGLSGPFIELACDRAEFGLAEARYVKAFREVLA